MSRLVYSIYSHADADGGIAAAIFGKFIRQKYGSHTWDLDIVPVNHDSQHGVWNLREISWPCAILDFTLHPQLMDERFFVKKSAFVLQMGGESKIPPCYWIDHHPTGASYSFLTPENAQTILTNVISKWDVTAISTPGLLRTHREELGLSLDLLKSYEAYIDLAEIIDGALYATAEAAHDFSNLAVKIQTLFNCHHPVIDRTALYKRLVRQIMHNPNPEELFDTDPIYQALIDYERGLFNKQMKSYRAVTKKVKNVAYANFSESKEYDGLSRFLPYILFPEAEYAVHVLPRHGGHCIISCGINPWNKPVNSSKHLGNYFAKHFGGGGHAFVAGGKVPENQQHLVSNLLSYIQEN
jgi:hypothetical protein